MRWNHVLMHVSFLFGATTTKINGPGIALVALIFCAFIGLWVYGRVRPRTNAQRIATARGWTSIKRDDATLSRFATWPFYLGRAHRAESVMTGVFEGHNVTLFDFRFQNFQGGMTVGIGPLAVPIGGQPKRADTGIFAGFDILTGVVTGKSRSRMLDRGDRDSETWGICVMEMPGTLTPVLIQPAFSVDGMYELFSEAIGVTKGGDQATEDLPMGDDEFDKKFHVRAEDPKIAAALLPKPTREMLLQMRNLMVHHATHIWTWDRYLFSLETMPLTEKMVAFRLPLMAKMIENVGP